MQYFSLSSFNVVFIAVLLLASVSVIADEQSQPITVRDAWVRLAPPVSKMTAAYLTITNSSAEDDRLLACSSTSAGLIEIHESITEEGIVSMEKRPSVVIPANGTITLKPGGLHLMIMKLQQPLKANQNFPLQLSFEKAGAITINVPIQSSADNPNH